MSGRAGVIVVGLACVVSGAIVIAASSMTWTGTGTGAGAGTGTGTGTGTGARAGPGGDQDAGARHVAFARDFEDFRSWERIPVEGAMLPIGAAPGPTAIYVSARPPAGTRRWPVGTILVKSIENGEPSEWVIHAMVKRGVPFNRDGAIGWEFFELAFAPGADAPHVVWRGTGPPSGHGYAAQGRDAGPDPVPMVCNDCHSAAWQNDGALTPALALVALQR